MKNILLYLALSIALLFGSGIFHLSSVQAQQCEGGFCMVDNQLCGEVQAGYRQIPDNSCTGGAYNGTACCPSAPIEGPDSQFFDSLNPLTNDELGGNPTIGEELTTPGGVVSRLLLFAFPLAGMILFVMLLWGGFEILAGSAGKKSLDAGKQRITAAVIGFILLFASYWIAQVLEIVFGVAIL